MSIKKSVQYCPSCDKEIFSEDINLSEGVALCSNCGNLSRLSQLNFTGSTYEEIIKNPPKECSVVGDRYCSEITVSLFSVTGFLGSLFVSLFWNGIVSVFLSLAAAAVYYNVFGPVPEWFPTPGLEDGKPIMNEEVMGIGETVFLCLFLTPFVAIGTCMIANTFLRLFGTTKVFIAKHGSYVSTGISIFRLKRSFDSQDVISIEYELSKLGQESEDKHVIEIVTSKKSTKLGLLLNVKQLEWLKTILKLLLVQKNHSLLPSNIPALSWLKD